MIKNSEKQKIKKKSIQENVIDLIVKLSTVTITKWKTEHSLPDLPDYL